jgi:hypothetical protein
MGLFCFLVDTSCKIEYLLLSISDSLTKETNVAQLQTDVIRKAAEGPKNGRKARIKALLRVRLPDAGFKLVIDPSHVFKAEGRGSYSFQHHGEQEGPYTAEEVVNWIYNWFEQTRV